MKLLAWGLHPDTCATLATGSHCCQHHKSDGLALDLDPRVAGCSWRHCVLGGRVIVRTQDLTPSDSPRWLKTASTDWLEPTSCLRSGRGGSLFRSTEPTRGCLS